MRPATSVLALSLIAAGLTLLPARIRCTAPWRIHAGGFHGGYHPGVRPGWHGGGARWAGGRYYRGGYYGRGWGYPVAAGVATGAALGALPPTDPPAINSVRVERLLVRSANRQGLLGA